MSAPPTEPESGDEDAPIYDLAAAAQRLDAPQHMVRQWLARLPAAAQSFRQPTETGPWLSARDVRALTAIKRCLWDLGMTFADIDDVVRRRGLRGLLTHAETAPPRPSEAPPLSFGYEDADIDPGSLSPAPEPAAPTPVAKLDPEAAAVLRAHSAALRLIKERLTAPPPDEGAALDLASADPTRAHRNGAA